MTVKVHFSSDLRRLTGGLTSVEASGATVEDLIVGLDGRFPGLGDRLRTGMAVVLNGELIAHPGYEPLDDGAEIYFMHQPSGG